MRLLTIPLIASLLVGTLATAGCSDVVKQAEYMFFEDEGWGECDIFDINGLTWTASGWYDAIDASVTGTNATWIIQIPAPSQIHLDENLVEWDHQVTRFTESHTYPDAVSIVVWSNGTLDMVLTEALWDNQESPDYYNATYVRLQRFLESTTIANPTTVDAIYENLQQNPDDDALDMVRKGELGNQLPLRSDVALRTNTSLEFNITTLWTDVEHDFHYSPLGQAGTYAFGNLGKRGYERWSEIETVQKVATFEDGARLSVDPRDSVRIEGFVTDEADEFHERTITYLDALNLDNSTVAAVQPHDYGRKDTGIIC